MKRLHGIFRSSIIRTMTGGFLLVIVPVMVLCAVSGYLGMRNMRQEEEHSYLSNIHLISDKFSARLKELQMMAATFIIDDEAIELSNTPVEKVNLWQFSQFEKKLSLYFSSQFISADVITVFPAQGVVVSTQYGVEQISSYSLLNNLLQTGPESLTWALRPSCLNPDRQCLSISMGYIDKGQSRPLMIIEIDEQVLTEQLKDLFQENVEVQSSFLIDPNGKSVRLDRQRILGSGIIEKLWNQYRRDGIPKSYSCWSGGSKLRVVPSILPDYNCIVGVAFDENEILMPVIRMIWLIIIILIFGTLMGAGYLRLAYQKVYFPVCTLVTAMRQVAVGDFTVRADVKGKGEFVLMAGQFNNMAEQLDKLLREKYLAEIKLKKAQLKFLQNQINPHFLYNSLFCLYNMIKSDDLDNAADMAIYLGQYYRIGARFNERDITVQQETENISLYVKIQQLRLSDRLEYSCRIEPGLEKVLIPSLSLQTIVENAMIHAFKTYPGQCILRISVFRREEKIILLVEDNGTGIGKEQLLKIQSQMQQPEEGDDIHGLQNVYCRMQLMFGEQAAMEVTPATPHGTRVQIEIPARGKEGGYV